MAVLTLRYLILVAASTAATAAVVAAVLLAMQYADPYTRTVAESIAAEKVASSPRPLTLQTFKAYYIFEDGKWVLRRNISESPHLPVYILAVGQCEYPTALLNKTYTHNNATVHVTYCSYVLPTVEVKEVVEVRHFAAICREGTRFTTEVYVQQLLLATIPMVVKLVLVKC